MNTTSPATKTVSIELPVAEYNFLKTLAKKMGWITKPLKTTRKKSELDLSLEDIEKGNYVAFDNADDAIAYLNS